MKKWLCIICGWIYDEALGWPDDGIAPGTRWEDIPDDWVCPECKVGKADFEMIEISEPAPTPAVGGVSTPVALNVATPAQPVSSVVQAPQAKVNVSASGPIVIIGSGHAGYGLAEEIRKSDPNVEICVLTSESGHRYYKPALSIALAQKKTSAGLIDEAPFQIESRLSIRIYPHCVVERVDPANKVISSSYGDIHFRKLVIASGARPIQVPLDGGAEAMVSVNNLDDYHAFRERLRGVKSVVILGDGLIGCEFANDLASVGYPVHVVGLGAWPMGRLLPESVGVVLKDTLSELGVRWSLGTTISKIQPSPEGLGVHLANGETLHADVVLSAVGLSPNVEFVKASGIACGRGIKVDEYLRTSVPDVFALGDCIEVDGQLMPYLAPINQGIPALSQTLLGKPTVVRYPLMPITVKTPHAPLSLLPPPFGASGEWQVDSLSDGLVASHKDDAGKTTGFVLLGRQAQKSRLELLAQCQ